MASLHRSWVGVDCVIRSACKCLGCGRHLCACIWEQSIPQIACTAEEKALPSKRIMPCAPKVGAPGCSLLPRDPFAPFLTNCCILRSNWWWCWCVQYSLQLHLWSCPLRWGATPNGCITRTWWCQFLTQFPLPHLSFGLLLRCSTICSPMNYCLPRTSVHGTSGRVFAWQVHEEQLCDVVAAVVVLFRSVLVCCVLPFCCATPSMTTFICSFVNFAPLYLFASMFWTRRRIRVLDRSSDHKVFCCL